MAFLWMMSGSSLYSSAVTHTFLNEVRFARMDPPIQAEYFLSGGAKILIFESLASLGSSSLTSESSLSP